MAQLVLFPLREVLGWMEETRNWNQFHLVQGGATG